MAFFCKWWNCPLEQVDEHQSEQCEKDGRTCVRCMEQADEEAENGK